MLDFSLILCGEKKLLPDSNKLLCGLQHENRISGTFFTMIFHYSIINTSKGMKKRALCPLSGVHLTIKPDFYLHRGTFFFQFVDFQCVVGEGFTFRCFLFYRLVSQSVRGEGTICD